MPNYVYPAIALIGGGTGALDAIDGTSLADKDMAMVSVQGDKTYFYVLNATSGAAEASPGIIAPDANGGDKRWLLVGFTPVPAATGFTIAGGTTSKTLTVSDNTTLDEAVAMSSKLTIPGAWTTPAFNAGDFTADTGTWTVEAGDVGTFAYTISGKVMTVSFNIFTTTVASDPFELRILIPASKTATKNMYNPFYVVDNSVRSIGWCLANGGQTFISLLKMDAGTWGAATNNTRVCGQLTFEIN